jgi:Domain of unknown function (DUF4329)
MDGGADEKWKVVASSKTIEGTARNALNKILKLSIERRREYGAMICLKAGQYVAFKARTQDEPNTVDVGQHEDNCGCPPGSTPVAYYHTHPIASQAGMKAEYNEFSDEDKAVAKEHHIDAYVGSVDGSFLKYDYKLEQPLRLRGRLKNS